MDQSFELPTYWSEIPLPTEDSYGIGLDRAEAFVAPGPLSAALGRLAGVTFDGDSVLQPAVELIQGMLPIGGVCFLGGQSGAGKTFVALDMAVALCTNQDFLGRRVREFVGVAFIAAEGAGTIAIRLEAARRSRSAPQRLPFATISEIGDLSSTKEVAALVLRLREIDVRFQEAYGCRLGMVIIDTVAAAFSMKDENDNAEGSRIIRCLRAISEGCKALVLAVHHYGKAAETGLRGASALRAGADAVISVLGERNEIAGTCINRSVAVAKSRTGSEGPVSGFELNPMSVGVNQYGEEYGSCSIRAVDNGAKSTKRRATSAGQLFDDAFCAAIVEFGTQHQINHNGPSVNAVKISDVRAEYLKRKVTGEEDLTKQHSSAMQAFRRMLATLPPEFATEVSGYDEWIWRPCPPDRRPQALQPR